MDRPLGAKPGCAWRLVDAFDLAMIAYLVLWRTTGDRFWPVYVVGFVAHLSLPAAFVWLLVAALRRRWGSLAVEGVCLAAFLWLFGDGFLGHDLAPPPDGATILTVMSYNLGSGLATPERLVPLLRESGADVVGLQELTPALATALSVELNDVYPHRVLHGFGTPGKGLLSRFPIARSELLYLNADRPDLIAVLDIGGTEVSVIVAHPLPPRLGWSGIGRRPGSMDQQAALVEVVEATHGPLLLLGDLNATRMHGLYDRLESAGMQDVYRLTGRGAGFTEPVCLEFLAKHGLPFSGLAVLPIMRIDYVWASEHWQPVDAWVGDGAGSDHLPVFARVAL